MIKDTLYTYRCKLIRVVDGDTIIAHIDLGFDTWSLKSIRLVGIDTPEIRTKNLEEKLLGQQAKDEVSRIFQKYQNENNEIYFYLKSTKYDNFGRCLGIVYTIDDLNVNDYLLENGFAVKYK
jgi:micrococcal nuclease